MKWIAAVLLTLATSHAAELIVAAASDIAPFTPQFEKEFSAARLRLSIGSSGSLTRQIENGAPFDVFLSASDQYINELAAKGEIDPASVTVFATGRLGLWSADGSVQSFQDLLKPQIKHVAIPNPEFAPYGIAARKALETRGIWKKIEPKIVYGENVRQALQFAESRNADAVITSWTLLKDRGILIPAEWHDPIRQAGGALKSSHQPALARQFLQFLISPQGRKILQAGGLFPP
jgi:molybdate transport system substrate-binding protein